MALLKDVPLDFITTTYEVIDTLSKKYAYPVQEYIYVTLTDHIFCSYQAVRRFSEWYGPCKFGADAFAGASFCDYSETSSSHERPA